MYCKYCGKEISDDSVFCQFCGKKMNDGTISSINHEKEEPQKKKNYTWIFVLLLIVIGGGGYYFINERIQEEEKYVKTHGTINGHEYVDLGLPSGLKWATCNVGATKPEGYGNYYAWGETTTKSAYTEDNSQTYGLSISELQAQGIIDGNNNLTSSHDAATANWGGDWRMPTDEEMQELIDKCTWTWTTQNGVKGYNVIGSNGNSIFLPAAGGRYGASLSDDGYNGVYWSSSPVDYDYYCAYFLLFGNGFEGVYDGYRRVGQTVRPVTE